MAPEAPPEHKLNSSYIFAAGTALANLRQNREGV